MSASRSARFGLAAVALALLAPALGAAQRADAGSDPLWAQRPLVSTSRAPVGSVVSTAVADVVLLAGGHDQGFREGMTCEVFRGGERIAELTVVSSETERCAALITARKADVAIRPGDIAKIKTVQLF